MSQAKLDFVAGLTLFCLAGLLLILIPGQVETTEGDTLTPASLPKIATTFILLLAAALVVQGYLHRREDGETGLSNYFSVYVFVAIGVMFIYVSLIPYLGYVPSTALALAALMFLYGNRNLTQIVLVCLVAPPLILLFFRYTMLVLLPQGTLMEPILKLFAS